MARIGTDRNDSRCLLCGKTREQVKKLILGVHGGVCLECVDLCNEIVRSDTAQADEITALGHVPKPKEIYQILSQYVVGPGAGQAVAVRRRLQPLQAHQRQVAPMSNCKRATSC